MEYFYFGLLFVVLVVFGLFVGKGVGRIEVEGVVGIMLIDILVLILNCLIYVIILLKKKESFLFLFYLVVFFMYF